MSIQGWRRVALSNDGVLVCYFSQIMRCLCTGGHSRNWLTIIRCMGGIVFVLGHRAVVALWSSSTQEHKIRAYVNAEPFPSGGFAPHSSGNFRCKLPWGPAPILPRIYASEKAQKAGPRALSLCKRLWHATTLLNAVFLHHVCVIVTIPLSWEPLD